MFLTYDFLEILRTLSLVTPLVGYIRSFLIFKNRSIKKKRNEKWPDLFLMEFYSVQWTRKRNLLFLSSQNSRIFDIDEINFNNVTIFFTMHVWTNIDERNQFYSLFILYPSTDAWSAWSDFKIQIQNTKIK